MVGAISVALFVPHLCIIFGLTTDLGVAWKGFFGVHGRRHLCGAFCATSLHHIWPHYRLGGGMERLFRRSWSAPSLWRFLCHIFASYLASLQTWGWHGKAFSAFMVGAISVALFVPHLCIIFGL